MMTRKRERHERGRHLSHAERTSSRRHRHRPLITISPAKKTRTGENQCREHENKRRRLRKNATREEIVTKSSTRKERKKTKRREGARREQSREREIRKRVKNEDWNGKGMRKYEGAKRRRGRERERKTPRMDTARAHDREGENLREADLTRGDQSLSRSHPRLVGPGRVVRCPGRSHVEAVDVYWEREKAMNEQ